MQIYDQLRQLVDVPPTFRRPTLIYQQLMAALAGSLTLLSEATSAGLDQTNYQKAVAGWIDLWADLAGLLRHAGEADSLFLARVPNMLLAPRDSIVAIQTWLQQIESLFGSIVIESPQVGYSVTLPGTLAPQRIADVAKNLAWVRPAGVPVDFSARLGGTYLNTVNYCGGTVYGQPILVGSPGTNYIRDSAMVNAQSGAPGVFPDFWNESHNTNLTPNVVGSGIAVVGGFNIPYIDLLFSGVAVAGNNNIIFETSTSVTAVSGDQDTESLYLQIIAGGLTNINNITMILGQRNSGGGSLGDLTTAVVPTSASFQRFSNTKTINASANAYVAPSLQVNPNSGAVNLTLRVGLPQINPGAAADIPTPTYGTAVSGGMFPLLTDQGIPVVITGHFPFQGGRVTGAYLAFKYTAGGALLPASTNNNVSQLPDLLLNDPTLNPNIAAPLTSV